MLAALRLVTATYSEPTTLWRLRHADGHTARAVLVPHGHGCSLAWWVDEQVEGAEECKEWAQGLDVAERVRAQFVHDGFTEVI